MAYVSQKDKAELAPEINKVLKKYGMKGSIAVRHHSTLVVNIRSGEIDFTGNFTHGDRYIQVNEYWIDDHYADNPVAKDFLNELLAAMKGPKYFCEDDIQSDYFCRSHYTDINIGRWNKPYIHNAKAPKKPVQRSKAKSIPMMPQFSVSDANETAEDLARMNKDQLNDFVASLVNRYPTLGEDLIVKLEHSFIDKDITEFEGGN